MNQISSSPNVPVENRPTVNYFALEQQGATLLVTLLRNIGSFAHEEALDELTLTLQRLDDPSVANLILDFGGVEYFGSNILEVVVRFGQRVRAKHGKMALCNISPLGQEILGIARFDAIYAILPSRAAALAAFSNAS